MARSLATLAAAAAAAVTPETEPGRALARVRQVRRGARADAHGEWDALTEAVVTGYRLGPRSGWAPVLLELMAPAMAAHLRRFHCPGPVTPEDLGQQFVLEMLSAALTIPLSGPRFLQRRLLLRAGGNLARWLQREARQSAAPVDGEGLPAIRD